MTSSSTNDTWKPFKVYNPIGGQAGQATPVSVEFVQTLPDGLAVDPQRVWTATSSGLLQYTVDGVAIKTASSPPVTIVSDNFNKGGSLPTLGTAQTGQVWKALKGTFGISANSAKCTVDATNNVAAIDAATSDFISISIRFAASSTSRILFRVVDASNYWFFGSATDNTYTIGKFVAGVLILVQTSTRTLAANDILRVDLRGNQIDAYVSTVQIATANDAFNNLATQHGFGCASGTPLFDDFSVISI